MKNQIITEEAVTAAADAVGNKSKLSRIFKLKTAQGVSNWIKRGCVPPEHVATLCRLCDYAYTPYQLRPDVFVYPTDAVPPELHSSIMANATPPTKGKSD
ncbi:MULTISPECIES: YdaS family helix-turn-helix protein [Enterobacter]|uniref:YdaS family helix-turn-helix protein n=1 Tax=Enterobacter TaxID=547 RepID=UPI002879E8B7|nr:MULTISPECIES: YdaS family helix-turn-helix protein [Enterobacter]MDS1913302.1 YdaS family helix-turn-helix protein [Enterobacter asburiae]